MNVPSLKILCISWLIRNSQSLNMTVLPEELRDEIMSAIRNPYYGEEHVQIRKLSVMCSERDFVEIILRWQPNCKYLYYETLAEYMSREPFLRDREECITRIRFRNQTYIPESDQCVFFHHIGLNLKDEYTSYLYSIGLYDYDELMKEYKVKCAFESDFVPEVLEEAEKQGLISKSYLIPVSAIKNDPYNSSL